jgi:hypothetical protein
VNENLAFSKGKQYVNLEHEIKKKIGLNFFDQYFVPKKEKA